MKVSLVAFLLLICVIATAATSPSRRLHVASPKEAHSADAEGFQGVESVDIKAEDVPVVDLKDGRKFIQKEENNDYTSSLKDEDFYKQVILDLRGQIQEREATIEELRDELRMNELNRRPDLQGDRVEPVLRFAWKFVLLVQASSKSLEKKENKADPLLSSRTGLNRPRHAGDSLHPQEMVSLIYEYGFVRRYKKYSKIFVCLTSTLLFYFTVSPGPNGPKSPRG